MVIAIILISNYLFFCDILLKSSINLNIFEEISLNLENSVWNQVKIIYFISIIISWFFLSYSFSKKHKITFGNINDKNLSISNSYPLKSENLSLKIGTSLKDNSGSSSFNGYSSLSVR